MKSKIIAVISTVITFCFILTGCGGTPSAQKYIGEIKTNMDACTSMDFDMHILSESTASYNETKIPQKIEYNFNVKETSQTAYITGEILTSVKDKNDKYEVEAYQTSANENFSLYYKQEDAWYRQDAKEYKRYGMELMKMLYSANMPFDEQKVTINEKECYQASAEVFGEAAADFAKMFGVETSEESKIAVTFYAYKDLKYPAYIKVDLTNVAPQAVTNDEMKVSIKELTAEITFNSFNESDVTLPEDIKKNAQKKQEGTEDIKIQEAEQTQESTSETNSEQSSEEPETTEPSTEPNSEVTPEEPSSENAPLPPEEEEEPEPIAKLSTEWNSFQFEYDGTIYRVPMAYKTFETSGFAMQEAERTMIMEQGQSYTTTLYKDNYSIIVKLENTTTSPKTLYECDIVSIDLDTYSLDADQLAKFMFNNDVNFAALYDNIIERWGEPTNFHEGAALKIASYKDGDNEIEILFDPATNEIIEYKITAH